MLTNEQHEGAIGAGIEAAVEDVFREKRDVANGAWRLGALIRLRNKMPQWKAAAASTLTTSQITETVRELARADVRTFIAERSAQEAP